MKHIGKWLGAASMAALAAFSANPAYAAGTTAGDQITNSVTVSYEVGGNAQTDVTASDTFTVDRKINLTVAEVGSATTSVTPNQTSAVTTFTVTNDSNAPLDFALAVAQLSGGTAAHGGTDSFTLTNVKIYRETGLTSGYSGDDELVTFLDGIAADDIQTLYVVADVPIGLSNGAVAGVVLTATAREVGASSVLGGAVSQTSGANNNNAAGSYDTVFADGAGATDSARFADHSAGDDYTVLTAQISATKTSRVVTDGFNSYPNAKAIPGATIEYCIKISNASADVAASNVSISDVLPAEVVWDSGYDILVGGTVDGSGVCQTDGSNTGVHSSGTITGTLTSLPVSSTRTLLFHATIQ